MVLANEDKEAVRCDPNRSEMAAGMREKRFIRAARQGDKTAQHNLGVYYATQEPAKGTTDTAAQ